MVPPNFTQPTQHRIMQCCCLLHGETHAKQCPNTLPIVPQQVEQAIAVILTCAPHGTAQIRANFTPPTQHHFPAVLKAHYELYATYNELYYEFGGCLG